MIEWLKVFLAVLDRPRCRRIMFGLLAAIAVMFTILPFIRFLITGGDHDYRTWFDAGQAVLQGREIYPQNATFPFMYPPSCAVLLSFAAVFGKAAMILVLCLLNTAAWFGCIGCCAILIAPKAFRIASTILPSIILLVFIWSSYHLGQPSLVLLFLMLAAFVALRNKRQLIAGASIGLAAAIKAFPVVAVIYLVYRRYWYAAIASVITLLLLLFVLPVPFRGFKQTVSDFRQWQRGMLRYNEGGIAQRAARGYSWKNQSIFGLTNRLLRSVSVNDEDEPVTYRNVADVDFTKVNVTIAILAFVLGLTFAAAIPRARAPEAAEFGAALILLLIVTPLAFGYLFSWLMLPFGVLLQCVLCDESRSAAWITAVALLLLGATAVAAKQAQIYGSLFFCALSAYLGLIAQVWREKRRAGSNRFAG